MSIDRAKRITVNDGYLEIHISGIFVYDIALSDLVADHCSGRMDWLNHLRQKRWFDPETELRFLEVIRRYCPEALKQLNSEPEPA